MTGLNMKYATAAIAAIASLSAAFPAAAGETGASSVKPAQGISLNIGSKQAVAYYLQENGGCRVSVTMIDNATDTAAQSASATRVNMFVGAGTSSQIDTADGPSLAISCAAGAAGLNLQTVSRTAYIATQQTR